MKVLLSRIFFLIALAVSTNAQWRYQLTDGAAILNDCLDCDRVNVWHPLKGSFDLSATEAAGVFAISGIDFRTKAGAEPQYHVAGTGKLDFTSGEPVLELTAHIQYTDVVEVVRMTNSATEGSRIFPMIGAQASEVTENRLRIFRLQVFAAPLREIWFSTTTGFVRSAGAIPDAAISHGDLLANNGGLIKRNREMTELLAIPDQDIGLDALDVGPRGEIFFSPTVNVESFVLGPINHGDIVSASGRLYLQNQHLVSPLGVDDPEAGLDALHFAAGDEIYFSVSKQVARANGGVLRRGDILSNKGRVVRTEAALLQRFINPLAESVGVDALYYWPNGEIWFSTETGFTSGNWTVAEGDILSDQGYVVYRNLDLLERFAPLERLADFGLDAMTVVSDVSTNTTPTLIAEVELAGNEIELRWESQARFFQVERADAVEGPYQPLTPITLERSLRVAAAGFYRVRQW